MEKYKVVKQAISKDALSIIKNTLQITKNVDYFLNNVQQGNTTAFGDQQYPNSYSAYGHHACESLMLHLQPLIERETGKKLLPTYSYARIYWKGSELAKHTDRPSCQYSISICIDYKDKPWDIYFDGDCLTLEPGDLVIYKGMEVEHWRLPYEGEEQTQIFLHYVDADGEHAECALDKRPILGLIKK
jgi:hypothetical protein